MDEIREREIKSIVTLESPDFLFSNMLPDKKIIVFESDGNICTKLEKKAPKHVEVIFGNINKLGIFNSTHDLIYLDFTGTWMTEQANIIKLGQQIKDCKLFILTLSTRESLTHKQTGNVWKGDASFDLMNKLQEIIGVNWKVVYGEHYYDSSQMVTLILENKNEI